MSKKNNNDKKNTKNVKKKKSNELETGFCCLCKKPKKEKINKRFASPFCRTCKKKYRELRSFFEENYPENHIPNQKDIVYLYEKHKDETTDIFNLIRRNPKICFTSDMEYYNKDKIKTVQKEVLAYIRSDEYKTAEHHRNDKEVPKYITDYFNKNTKYKCLGIEGNKENPTMFCQCLSCKKDFGIKYSNRSKIHKVHNCEKKQISSGEAIIKDYLTINKIHFRDEYSTLKCINPKTNYQLPYDFELIDYKIIIEVQGEQHFEFSEYFHGTVENFEYQQYKDKIKKDYAISKGYEYLEILYDDIKSGVYRRIIEEAIKEKKEEQA